MPTESTKSAGAAAPWITIACVIGVTTVLLHWVEGQRWWCVCGSPRLWTSDVWSTHCSRHLGDAYTFAHFEHGLIFFTVFAFLTPSWSLAWRLSVSLALAASWEVLENSSFIINRYRDSTMSVEYLGDAVINSLGDIAACFLGFCFARRFGIVAAVLTLVVIEVALMLVIRDNLTVGTLMLIWPIDWIKDWQMAGQPGS